MGDGDDNIIIGIEVLGVEFLGGEGDLGTPGIAVFLLEFERLLLDNGKLLGLAGKDLLAAGDEFLKIVIFCLEAFLLQSGELAEPHLNDGRRLDLSEAEG